MAIIIRGKTNCSICGSLIVEGDDLVATQHFIQDQSNPLWRYSDSAMHRSCFIGWNGAEPFRATFNQLCGEPGALRPMQMLEDGTVVVGAAADVGKAVEDPITIAVLGSPEGRAELLAELKAKAPPLCKPDQIQSGGVRPYKALVSRDANAEFARVTVGARSLSEARGLLEVAYGAAHVLSIVNEDDAAKVRGPNPP